MADAASLLMIPCRRFSDVPSCVYGMSIIKIPPLPIFSMCSLVEQLTSQQVWEEYLAYRLQKGRLNWREFESLDEYVEMEEYHAIASRIIGGEGLSLPRKSVINKMGTGKKRIVYSFSPEEMQLLKVLSFLLYRYDDIFAPNCYAFRRGLRAHDAVLRIHKRVCDSALWAYKLDIHDYFNSISVPLLLGKLEKILGEDRLLYRLFEQMLSEERVVFNGEVVNDVHGVMAGVPTASFLANVYLSEMDHYFAERGVIYARYSDDIIIFADTLEELQQYKGIALKFLEEHHLEVNPSKEHIYAPGEPYEFLGFRSLGREIGVSDAGVAKMKAKISRKMRSILRWKQRHRVSNEVAMSRLIRHFNRKFFEESDDLSSLNWSRWYFPIINSVDGLRKIDHYLQHSIRVVATGRHSKSQYKISYERMTALGYKSLVHAYYQFRKQRDEA